MTRRRTSAPKPSARVFSYISPIERPGSVAVAPMHNSAATADAEPPDEPPGTKVVLAPSRRHRLITGPKHEVSFDEPIANSSLLSLPSMTAPSRQSCEVTVDS